MGTRNIKKASFKPRKRKEEAERAKVVECVSSLKAGVSRAQEPH